MIHLEERQSGMPEAIENWYYPGDNTDGRSFIPKDASDGREPMPAPAPALGRFRG